jgi:8-oxo-dGTP diphosphatase
VREFGEKIEGVEYRARPSSYALIVEENRVGVVQSPRTGKYFLIGGGQDAGESEAEALRREAREEIGYEIEIQEKIGAAIEYFYAENDRQYFAKKCNFYRTRLLGKNGNEAEGELLWLGAGELGEMFHRSHEWIAARELKI